MKTIKNFKNEVELAAYVKNLTATDKTLLARENKLDNAKSETIIKWYFDNGAIVEPVALETKEDDKASEGETESQPTDGQPEEEKKSENAQKASAEPSFNEEELKKITAHFNGKVKALNTMLDEVVGTMEKLSFLDGEKLDEACKNLQPVAKNSFGIDVSSLPAGYFADANNVAAFKSTFDIKAMALQSYDGSFKFDGKPVTIETVKMALAATVSEFDKFEAKLNTLRDSEEYKLAISTYAIFREQMFAAINKHAEGAEFIAAFEVKNPHKATKAKGNSTSVPSSATGERSYTRINSGKVLKANLHLTKKHALGEIVITTAGEGEWKVTCQPNDGDDKVWSYDNDQHTLSSAITSAYQAVTGSHGQKSVYVYLGEDNFVQK